MRSLVFTGLGVGFLLMGVGLYALTWRKPKTPSFPTKAQLREMAELAEETKKMRVAASVIAVLGAGLVIFSFI
jgi:hypothetical protein